MEYKVCPKCKTEKAIDLFAKDKSSKDGIQSYCKECNKQYRNNIDKAKALNYRKNYYENNKERLLKSCKEYKKKHHDILLNQAKEYYRTHYAEVRAYTIKNQEVINIKSRKNKQKYKHTEKGRLNSVKGCQKRRAKKSNALSTLTIEQWKQIKEEFNNECCYCGKKTVLTQEHFTPVINGGYYTYENILPCCKSCNASKSNREFFEWYPLKNFYNKERETKILNHIQLKYTP